MVLSSRIHLSVKSPIVVAISPLSTVDFRLGCPHSSLCFKQKDLWHPRSMDSSRQKSVVDANLPVDDDDDEWDIASLTRCSHHWRCCLGVSLPEAICQRDLEMLARWSEKDVQRASKLELRNFKS